MLVYIIFIFIWNILKKKSKVDTHIEDTRSVQHAPVIVLFIVWHFRQSSEKLSMSAGRAREDTIAYRHYL